MGFNDSSRLRSASSCASCRALLPAWALPSPSSSLPSYGTVAAAANEGKASASSSPISAGAPSSVLFDLTAFCSSFWRFRSSTSSGSRMYTSHSSSLKSSGSLMLAYRSPSSSSSSLDESSSYSSSSASSNCPPRPSSSSSAGAKCTLRGAGETVSGAVEGADGFTSVAHDLGAAGTAAAPADGVIASEEAADAAAAASAILACSAFILGGTIALPSKKEAPSLFSPSSGAASLSSPFAFPSLALAASFCSSGANDWICPTPRVRLGVVRMCSLSPLQPSTSRS
mmetsp:Transcript_23475/g.67645  ORF Transcript_23475/g.67645 Transcript_23475/m.67645 type:complete len:284 (+) Transcript_23475:1046-1897(+)